jgi:hypothetical protein
MVLNHLRDTLGMKHFRLRAVVHRRTEDLRAKKIEKRRDSGCSKTWVRTISATLERVTRIGVPLNVNNPGNRTSPVKMCWKGERADRQKNFMLTAI